MNDQRADFPGLIRTISVPNPPHTNPPSNAATTTTAASTSTTAQRNTSSSAVAETTSLITSGGGGVTLAARMRSASDGLAEADQTPSVADELAPGDDFFDMIFRLQVRFTTYATVLEDIYCCPSSFVEVCWSLIEL